MVPLFITSFGEGPGASLFQGLFFFRFLTSNDFNFKKYASGFRQLLGGWLEYTLKRAPKTSFEKDISYLRCKVNPPYMTHHFDQNIG